MEVSICFCFYHNVGSCLVFRHRVSSAWTFMSWGIFWRSAPAGPGKKDLNHFNPIRAEAGSMKLKPRV